MKLYRTRTQKEYDWLMKKLEGEGYKTFNRKRPTETDFWDKHKELTVTEDENDVLSYRNIDFVEEFYPNEPIIEVSDLMRTTDPLMAKVMERNNKPAKPELVNHPDHYQGNKLEVIDIIEDYNLNFHLGSVIKYVLRAGKKDSKSTDLEKAIWYLERELENENKN